MPHPRHTILAFRVSPTEAETLRLAARLQGKALSALLRETAMKTATKALAAPRREGAA